MKTASVESRLQSTMYSKVVIVVALAAFVAANDIHQGTNNTLGLEPFFKGHFAEEWAYTGRATKDILVNSSGIISAINVTDLRDTKDGEATIVSGGVGHNYVTISLKSPAVFRGYDFLVEVYSDEEIHRGGRGEDSATPQVTVKPVAESKPTDKPVTGSTGKPSTELPTADKDSTTFATTGKPDVTLSATGKSDISARPEILPAGTPELTGPAEVTGVLKMEMEVLEEVEDMPMTKQIGFNPPKKNH